MVEHEPLDYESLPPGRKAEYARSKRVLGVVAAFGFMVVAIHLTRASFTLSILAIGSSLIRAMVFTLVALGVTLELPQ